MSRLLIFERIENYIIALPIFLIAILFGWLYFNTNSGYVGEDCSHLLTGNVLDLGSADYIKAAATADRNCVDAVVARFGDQSLPFTFASGFASASLSGANPNAAIDAMYGLIEGGGETYFFANDTDFLGALGKVESSLEGVEKDKARAVFDFILANSPDDTRKRITPFDMQRYLMYAPLDDLSVEQISAFCAMKRCNVSADAGAFCSLSDPAVILLVKNDPITGKAKIDDCTLTPEYIIFLRKNGFANGNCSSTLQVNASMDKGKFTNCDDLLRQIGSYSFSDQDVISYLREYSHSENRYHLENLTVISRYFSGAVFGEGKKGG